ncbi:MAG: hypothetical protein ABSH56_33230 [Bryobacteraceae bacterium]|jgi:hypothetical protein
MLTKSFQNLLLGYAICLGAWPGASAAQGLTSAPIREFSRTGPTAEVVRGLMRSMYQQGVFERVVGFESLNAPGHVVSLAAANTDLGAALRTICGQDPSYKVVDTSSPHLINLLAADGGAPGREVLEFRLPRFDLDLDELPQNLILKLPDYSPVLTAYLRGVYLGGGGTEPDWAPVGSGLSGDGRLPHFAIHLSNVSVREVLNAIALESFRMYKAIGIDPRLVHAPDQLRVTPCGWEFRFESPRGVPFWAWLRQIFVPL